MKTYLIRLQFILAMALVSQVLAQSYVASVSPKPNALNVPQSTNITISFNTDIDISSLGNSTIKVNGAQSGLHKGSIANSGARNATFNPNSDFKPGEVVTVTLTTGIKNIPGDPMPSGYSWSFTITASAGSGAFKQSSIAAEGNPRLVTTGDFDGDGDLDLAVGTIFVYPDSVSILKNDGKGNYKSGSSIVLEQGLSSMVAGDWDADADLDLAATAGGKLFILKNNGTGSFSKTSTTPTGLDLTSAATADFDGDGDLDLAASSSSYYENQLLILKNDGNGAFTKTSTTNLTDFQNTARSIVTGDLDGDSYFDLVVALDGELAIFKNDGNGGFTKRPTLPISNGLVSLVLADLDGDLDNDLAVTFDYTYDNDKSLLIFKNNGTGTFTQHSTLNVDRSLTITTGDLDSDGDLDLAGSHFYHDGVWHARYSTLLNDGSGNFSKGLILDLGDLVSANLNVSVVAGDFDSDGGLELAVASFAQRRVLILDNRPKVQDITLPANSLNFGTLKSNTSKSLTFQIVNDGGLNPLQISNITASNGAFLANPVAKAINGVDTLNITVTFTPTEVRIYDDSLAILSNDPDEPTVKLYLKGIGAPIFVSSTPSRNVHTAKPETNISSAFNSQIQKSTIQDASFRAFGEASGKHAGAFSYNGATKTVTLNPDNNFVIGEKVQVVLTTEVKSDPDLTPLLDGCTWKFTVAPLSGSGRYNMEPANYTPGVSPFAIAVGDFNKDGYSDFVVANSGGNSVKIFTNNKSDGFNPLTPISTNGANPQGVTVADIDADGDADIISANNGSNNISILKNQGNGSFGTASLFLVGTGPRAIAAADLDNDGNMDIVTANISGNNISVLFNDGTGTLGAAKNTTVGNQPSGVILEDLDSDGDIDIAVSNKISNNVTILLNKSNKSFANAVSYAVGKAPNGIVAYDFDGDGDVDLATANGTDNNILILSNNGKGVFSSLTNFPAGTQPVALYGNDLDADGDIDLAAANFDSKNIVVYKNNGSALITETTFTPSDTVMVGSGPRAITGLDISGGGGIIDLAVVNLTAGNIFILKDKIVGPPEAPKNLQAVAGDKKVTLTWTANTETDLLLYRIYRNTASPASTKIDSVAAGVTTYVDNKVVNGTTYFYRITAVDIGLKQSGYSNEANATPMADIPPAAPQNLQATASDRQVTLTWTANIEPDFLRYRIYRGTASNPTTKVDSVDGKSNTSKVIGGLTNGTKYYFRITAVDIGLKQSGYSNEVNAIPVPALAPPTPSYPFDGATDQPSMATLSWNPVSGATAYRLQVSTNFNFTTLIFDHSAITSTSKQVGPLANNSTFYWRVRAEQSSTTSGYSQPWRFTTLSSKFVSPPTPISFPSNPTASTNYRLFSVPAATENAFSVGALIASGEQKFDWRVYRDNGRDSDYLEELSSDDELRTGKGYWLIKKNNLSFSKNITMPALDSDATYSITLHEGWNIIGNPFDKDVAWSAVIAANSLNQSADLLRDYDGTNVYPQSNTLKPFKGYYFFNDKGLGSLKIPYPFAGANADIQATTPPAVDWKVQLIFNSDINRDAENYLGIATQAKADRDELDSRKPPLFLDLGFLYFSRPVWDAKYSRFSADFRPALGEGQVWEFEVSNPRYSVGKISFRGIEAIPSEYEVTLINLHNTAPVDLRAQSEYTYQTVAIKMPFKLVVGKKVLVNQETSTVVPKEFELAQNFPNPFNPATSITFKLPQEARVRLEVISVLGQRVKTLAEGHFTPAVYTVVWDGTDQAGNPVAAGVYFYRLFNEGKVVQIRKMILTK